jgi:hypothetical protein
MNGFVSSRLVMKAHTSTELIIGGTFRNYTAVAFMAYIRYKKQIIQRLHIYTFTFDFRRFKKRIQSVMGIHIYCIITC